MTGLPSPGPTFRIPFARAADGRSVRPAEAFAGQFSCPDCGTPVSLRRAHVRDGVSVRAHFTHRPSVTCGFSHGEGELHLLAKRVLRDAVVERRGVTLVRGCRGCGRTSDQRLPERVVSASLEHTLPSGRRADVALFDAEGALLAVVEVRETHAVDDIKRADLAGLRWCEIEARQIIASQRWTLLHDELIPFICRPCRSTKLRTWSGEARLEVLCPLPGAGTVVAVDACGRCSYFVDAADRGIRCWGGAP